ncbi:MAG: hypothetical protein U0842_11060 [Candidatus Binatia bacterium]
MALPAGSLDPTFGSGGIVLVDVPPTLASLTDLAIDAQDGLAILAWTLDPDREVQRQVVVLRRNADGSPNVAFGDDGFVETAVAPRLAPCTERPCDDAPTSLLVLPDGRVLVSAVVDSQALQPDRTRGVLVLYRSDGSLDPGFGDGGVRALSAVRSPVRIGDLQFDSAGRIVGVGVLGGAFADSRFTVARLRADLAPDGGFGIDGFASAAARDDLAPGFGRAGIRPDDGIVAGGGSGSFDYRRPEIAAFTSDGSLDKSFGREGFVDQYPADLDLMAGIDALAVDPDGRITAAIDDRLVRYTPAGNLDDGFGNGGVVPAGFLVSQVLALPDGRVLATGNVRGGGGIVTRWDVDGSPDESFGSGGVTMIAPIDGRPAYLIASAVDSRGRLLVIGRLSGPDRPRLFLARYLTEDTDGFTR